ncbi:MAG: AMP-dependent synthetase, partial [Deltaproteobacteria bacterium]|nr:AMP-dependent synthetase [Deltaproteobacteria bacterium]
VGVPDPIWGQRPMAIVSLVPGATETEEDVIKWLEEQGVEKGRITRWMLPDYIAITNEIPKTSVGKFNKREIAKNLEKFLDIAKKMRED